MHDRVVRLVGSGGRTRGLIVAAAAAAALPVAGLDLQWDPSASAGVQGGAGTWQVGGAASWFNGTANVSWAASSNDTAIFAGTAGGAVNVSGTVQARSLLFDAAGYLLSGGVVQMSPQNGTITTNLDVVIGSTFQTANGMDGWHKRGAGTLSLSGANPNYIAIGHLEEGALSFDDAASLPAQFWLRMMNPGVRLRYAAGNGDGAMTNLTLNADAVVEVTGASRAMAITGSVSGTNTLIKEGPGTLTLRNVVPTARVSAGTLRLEGSPTSGSSRVNLAGGTLALAPTLNVTTIGNPVSVEAGATGRVAVVASLSGARYTIGPVTVPAGTVLETTAGAVQSLVVPNLSLDGVVRVASGGLVLNGPLTGGGTFTLVESAQNGMTPVQSEWDHGLHFASSSNRTLSNNIGGSTNSSNPIVGVDTGMTLTYQGLWDMGLRNNKGSTLVLRGGGRFVFGGSARAQTTYSEVSGSNSGKILNDRPMSVVGDGTGTLELDASFRPTLGTQQAPLQGLSNLHVGNVTLTTNNSASLPLTWMHGAIPGQTVRRGSVEFDLADGARWVTKTTQHLYDGKIVVRRNVTFQTDLNLGHNGNVGVNGADAPFNILDGATLTKTGPGQLQFNGRQGHAPGAKLQVNAGNAVFTTDPGEGYLPGAYSLNVNGQLVAAPPMAPNLSVIVDGGQATFNASVSRLDGLDVNTGTAVVPTTVAAPYRVLAVKSLEIGPNPSGVAKLDLNGNRLVVDYTGASPMAAVRAMVVAGYGTSAGHWDGNGIASTALIGSTSRGIGYAEAAEVFGLSGTATANFGLGAMVDATSVVVRPALLGDANLDGAVDFNDLVRLAQNYNTAVSAVTDSWWFNGDFTNDGVADFADLVKLAQNYNSPAPGGAVPGAAAGFAKDWAAAVGSVPEPGAIGALGALNVWMLRRRRRG